MGEGRIIFLNGASSSGKSTIARALQETLEEPYMYLAVDTFYDMFQQRYVDGDLPRETVQAVMYGFKGAVAALASAGCNVIVDDVVDREPVLRECAKLFAELPSLFVGVHAPLEVLKQREAERGDRVIGLAEFQFERVHRHGIYDVEVDTSRMSVSECVQQIRAAIKTEHDGSSAFKRLRDAMAGEEV